MNNKAAYGTLISCDYFYPMFAAQRLPYKSTGAFSKIVLDYLESTSSIIPFYTNKPNIEGIKEAIAIKEKQPLDRKLLVNVLTKQYQTVETSEAVQKNIERLNDKTTFSICTAHQPNLFTGPLYFIYKILHAIRLADELKEQLPAYHFVPVFYMGSEDADLAELNHFTVEGKRYQWETTQKGAVGRMVIDKELVKLIDELDGQLSVHEQAEEWSAILRNCFQIGRSIQEATFQLVNQLFSSYGLVVIIADHPELKATMHNIFEQDLFQHTPAEIVSGTGKKLQEFYDEQAHARPINLFYLKDDIRERLERSGDSFNVCHTNISFTESELKQELNAHPERFSPNVILRGLYQETILPNIAFIGGGGEVAYWLQLKDLFDHYHTPFPVLILRNSFLILEKKWQQYIDKLGLDLTTIFKPAQDILNTIVQANSTRNLSLNGKLEKTTGIYDALYEQVHLVDPTLTKHVAAIKKQALDRLKEVEKKMLRAEKRKFLDQQNQVEKLKAILFPGNGLQERVDNLAIYYAKWGKEFIDLLYKNTLAMEQEFTILLEQD